KKEGFFDINEVVQNLTSKMIHRHPHIFGEAQAESEEDLKHIWATAKAEEGKVQRVNFEKVLAEHFMKLYDITKNMSLDEAALKQFLERGGDKS
ncbi:nucleotide pyrophosphohydrolase, partial [Mammaliicoccus sciuri]